MVFSDPMHARMRETCWSLLASAWVQGFNEARCFVARTVILQLVAVMMDGVFILENPQNSLIQLHPRCVWLARQMQRLGLHAPGTGRVVLRTKLPQLTFTLSYDII